MHDKTASLGIWLAAVLWIVGPVVAQQGGQTAPGGGAATAPATSPGPTTTTPTPSPGRPTTPTMPSGRTQPSQNEQQIPFPEIARPIFLSGKVVLQDGTPPPESVVIERVCNGVVRPEAYTDSKGRFSFQLGQNNSFMADASVGADSGFGNTGSRSTGTGGFNSSSGISERDLWGCEIRASLAGYTSEAVSLGGRRSLDNPEIGTILLHRFGNVEGTTISMTSLQAPKEAQKAFNKGRDSMKKEKWADAQKQFEKAVGVHPQYAAAWFEMGVALEKSGDTAKARESYAKALQSDPKYINPYIQLTSIAARESKWQEVADTAARALKLDPYNYPNVYFYDAVAAFNLQRLDDAEKSAREALKLDPQHRIPAVNHILGVILARKGEFEAAAGFMKTYLQLAPAAADTAVVKRQLAEIEKVAQTQPGVTR
jgi:tetratricopeptide (TPR) repeat protein